MGLPCENHKITICQPTGYHMNAMRNAIRFPYHHREITMRRPYHYHPKAIRLTCESHKTIMRERGITMRGPLPRENYTATVRKSRDGHTEHIKVPYENQKVPTRQPYDCHAEA
eukprot:7129711-Pyramimonas_sp.AAC.1